MSPRFDSGLTQFFHLYFWSRDFCGRINLTYYACNSCILHCWCPSNHHWRDHLSSFPEKKQKRLFCFAEGYVLPKARRSRPRGSGGMPPAKLYVKPLSSFPEKKQKRLFCFAEDYGLPKARRSRPRGSGGMPPAKLYVKPLSSFSRKEAKAFVLLRRRLWATQSSAKPTQGVWGRAPRYLTHLQRSICGLFPKGLPFS
jgi:hypothetical protein